VRVAASVKQSGQSRAPSSGAAALYPLQGERQNLPRTRSGVPPSAAEVGEGSSGHPPSSDANSTSGKSRFARSSSRQGAAVIHPLRGERQIRASSAEIGEGSSGHPGPKPSTSPAVPITLGQLRLTSLPSLQPLGMRDLPGNRPLGHAWLLTNREGPQATVSRRTNHFRRRNSRRRRPDSPGYCGKSGGVSVRRMR